MNNKRFQPGFRLSILDVSVLIAGLCLAFVVYKFSKDMAYMVLFVVGHFFLFCNIVRMSRLPELIWATTFTALFALHTLTGRPTLLLTFTVPLLLTLVLVTLELKKPSYHGIGWSKFNPNLKIWFENKMKELT